MCNHCNNTPQKEVRIATDDENVVLVIRFANGGFQFMRETTTHESEPPGGVGDTTTQNQTIITREIAQEINDF